jgi:hypothetical protein
VINLTLNPKKAFNRINPKLLHVSLDHPGPILVANLDNLRQQEIKILHVLIRAKGVLEVNVLFNKNSKDQLFNAQSHYSFQV